MATIRVDHWTKLGATIRDARLAHDWSQQELAARAHVSRSWLARVEAGHRGTELEPLLRLLEALGLTLHLDAGDAGSSPPQPSTRRREAAQARAHAWQRPTSLVEPSQGDAT